jgi:predicted ATPase
VLEEHLGDAGVRYQVTHPLFAEVAYEELPAVVRCRTHAAIASALARLDPGDVSRLAHHVRGAGDEVDAGTALDVLVAALERALESKAGEEAVGHAEAAIGLVHRLGRGELLPRLQEQRAEALELAGRGDAAIAAWRAAAESSVARGQAVDRGDHFVNRDDPAAVAERLWWVWDALHAATTVNGARRASAAHVFDVIAERRRWAGT